MTSSLASQLARLQQRPGNDKTLAHSFLFTDADAKQFSREQIYELAVTGLQTLMRIDNRFHPFLESIFAKSTVRRERAMLVAHEQKTANAAIHVLLTILSPHLFLTAAQQAFEYLVRVWEVHTFNVTDVLAAFLPYHDHPMFARALMLLDLRDTGFETLTANQLNGAPLLGSHLRTLCGESRKALRVVCSCAVNAVRCHVTNHAAFALFTGVCSGLAVHPDGEALFRAILPAVSDFLMMSEHGSLLSTTGQPSWLEDTNTPLQDAQQQNGNAGNTQIWREAASAALVVLCAWCQETQLGSRVLSALLKPLLRSMLRSDFPVPLGDTLTVLGLVFQTQTIAVSDLGFTPVLSQAVALPWRDWASYVAVAGGGSRNSATTTTTAHLLSALLQHVCSTTLLTSESVGSIPHEVLQFLVAAAEVLPLRIVDVRCIVATIAERPALHAAFCGGAATAGGTATDNDGGISSGALVAKVLPALRRRYPMAFEEAVVSLLRDASSWVSEVDAPKRMAPPAQHKSIIAAAGGSPKQTQGDRGAATLAFFDTFFGGLSAPSGDAAVQGDQCLLANKMLNVSGATSTANAPHQKQQQRLPMSVCLLHYLPEVRTLALRDLMRHVQGPQTIQSLFVDTHQGTTAESSSVTAIPQLLLHVVRFEEHADVAELAFSMLTSWMQALQPTPGSTPSREVQHFRRSAVEAVYLATVRSCKQVAVLGTAAGAASSSSSPTIAKLGVALLEETAATAASVVSSNDGCDAVPQSARYFLCVVLATMQAMAGDDAASTNGQLSLLIAAAEKALHQRTTTTAGRATPAHRNLDLAACTEVSVAHLNTVLHTLTNALRSKEDHTEDEVELGLIAANAVAAAMRGGDHRHDDEVGTASRSSAASVSMALLERLAEAFNNKNRMGYMATLHAMELELVSKQLEAGVSASGRGAKTLSTGGAVVAQNRCTNRLAQALMHSFVHGLQDQHRACPATTHAVVLVLKLLRTLGHDLPSMLLAPALQSAALMECLSQHPASHRARDEWRDTIIKCLFLSGGPQSRPTHLGQEDVAGTLALALLLPTLFSDDAAERLQLLQKFQGMVTESMATPRNKVVVPSCAMAWAVQHAVQNAMVSATGLSAIIETYALSIKGTHAGKPGLSGAAAPLPLEAARCVASWIAQRVPAVFMPSLIALFFPPASAVSSQQQARTVATTATALRDRRNANTRVLIQAYLPMLDTLLAESSNNSRTLAPPTLSSAMVEVLGLICAAIDGVDATDDASPEVALLRLLLSRAPSVLVAESGSLYAPLYRDAFHAMSRVFAVEEECSSSKKRATVFVAKKKSAEGNSHLDTTATTALASVGAALHTTIPALWDKHGADAAAYTARSSAGFHYVLQPLMKRDGSLSVEEFGLVVDVLEAKFSSAQDGVWAPLSGSAGVVLSPALRARDVVAFIGRSCLPAIQSGTVPVAVEALRALTMLLRFSSSLQFDSNEDDDEDDGHTAVPGSDSLTSFVAHVFTMVPMVLLAPLTTTALAPQSSRLRTVLAYIETLCAALGTGTTDAKLRRHAAKEALSLVSEMLSSTTPSAPSADEDASAPGAMVAINFIGKVLVAIAPLLQSSATASAVVAPVGTGDEEDGTLSLLHVVVLSLMLRLEPLDGTEALQFRSAVDCCRDIVTSFDVDTQMQCLTGIMTTLLDPEHPTGKGAYADQDAAATNAVVAHLLKPNKILNRQESIMYLVVSTVKSDAFLGPFIAQQQRGKSGGARHQKLVDSKKKKSHATDDDAAALEDDNDAATAAATAAHSSCMKLLVAALNVFAHYHGLNESVTAAAAGRQAAGETQQQTEDSDFATLLELLAGNALACILAGINEPTFVECQSRLLNDSRVTLQLKGLEMLMDRLHQSVPTHENVLTDAEAAQRRLDIQDPKKKLTDYDLVLLKARPLTTKRTMALFPVILHLATGAIRFVVRGGVRTKTDATAATDAADTVAASSHDTLVSLAQLAIASMEEMVRIVGSGGSLISEATLAHGQRSLQVPESQVHKLFGTKAKAAEVMVFLTMLLKNIVTVQQHCSHVTTHRNDTRAGTACLALLASMTTAIATITQTMGAAFVSDKSNDIIMRCSQLADFSVAHIPGELVRTSAAQLLRVAALNSVGRIFTATWMMCAPYLPTLLSVCAHQQNTSDGDAAPLATELLATIQSLLEPRVLLEGCCSAIGGRHPIVHATTHSFEVFFGCVQALLERLSRSEVASMAVLVGSSTGGGAVDKDTNFWVAALHSLAAPTTLPSADAANAVYDAIITFLIKFKSEQCTRHLSTLLSWAFEDATITAKTTGNKQKGSGTASSSSAFQSLSRNALHRVVVFCGLYNRMLGKLQSLADFSFPMATNALVSMLIGFQGATGGGSNDSDEDETNDRPARRKQGLDALVALALESALDAIRRMADAQCPAPDQQPSTFVPPYFAETSVFNALMPPLMQQLGNTAYLADDTAAYELRVSRCVVPAIRSYFKSLSSSMLWSKAQGELLKHLRSPKYQVRRAVLSAFRGIYTDGGDEMAATIMSEMLPAVVEATEDTHSAVVEEARLLCNDLSGISGRDVLHAMS